ncbi:MAG: O-antigen ligase family protein [Acidobacteriota bacterium]
MLRTILVLLILVPGIVRALWDRYAALLLYLWFAFFRPQDWMWIDVTGLRLSLFLGLLLLFPSLLSGILPNISHPLSIGALLFLVSTLLAQIGAVDQSVGWQWIDFLTRLILVCLLTVSLVRTPRRFIGVVAVVACSLGFYGTKAGLASLIAGGVQFGDGLAGAFVDSNGYALAVVMSMPLLFVAGENADLLLGNLLRPWIRTLFRLGCFAAMPLCAFCVVSTFSRGGFLGLTAALLAYIALHRYRVPMLLVLSALAVGAYFFVPLPKGYAERLSTIQNYDEINEESAIARLHFWRVAVRMAEAQPLGVGLKNYEAAYDKYDFLQGRYGSARSVHSSHFEVLAELGFFGAAVWIGLFVYSFAAAFRIRRVSRRPGLPPDSSHFLLTTSTALLASMVGFLVGGSFIALMLNDLTWVTFSLVAALDRLARQMAAEAIQRSMQTSPAIAPSPFQGFRPAVATR